MLLRHCVSLHILQNEAILFHQSPSPPPPLLPKPYSHPARTDYACGPVDRAVDRRSKGLVFDSQCWSCVEVSGKLRVPHCLGPPSHNGYLVHRYKVGLIVAGFIGTHLVRGKVKSVEHALSWSLDFKQLPLPLPLCKG